MDTYYCTYCQREHGPSDWLVHFAHLKWADLSQHCVDPRTPEMVEADE